MRADPGPDTVYVEGGTYRLLTPLTLSAADSNSSFLAYPGQQPVLSGGTPVGGWTAGADGIWHAHLALNSVTQFVVNGLAQTELRFPNYDAAQPITGGWLWTQPLPAGYDPNLDLAYNKADFPAGAPVAGEKITVFDQVRFRKRCADDRLGRQPERDHSVHRSVQLSYRDGQPLLHFRQRITHRSAGRMVLRPCDTNPVLLTAGRFRRHRRRGGRRGSDADCHQWSDQRHHKRPDIF